MERGLDRVGMNLTHTINGFLYFGYVPDVVRQGWDFPFDSTLIKEGRRVYGHLDYQSAVRTGAELLMSLVDPQQIKNQRNVLLLSGGLDSRFLLGVMRKHNLLNALECVTFGEPGMLDVDIASQTADVTGVRFELLDTRNQNFDLPSFNRETAKDRVWVPLARGGRRQINEKYGSEAVYWDGYFNGHLTTKNESYASITDDRVAWKAFKLKNRTCGGRLASDTFDPDVFMPDSLAISRELLAPAEQYHIGLRQHYYVSRANLRAGWQWETPYTELAWVKFMLGVPAEYRSGQKLFRDIGRHLFPDLMEVPVKRSYGLPMNAPKWRKKLASRRLKMRKGWRSMMGLGNGPAPSAQEMDWDNGIREIDTLKQFLQTLLFNLDERGVAPWLSGMELLDAHLKGKKNLSKELMLLASLEVSLQRNQHDPETGAILC